VPEAGSTVPSDTISSSRLTPDRSMLYMNAAMLSTKRMAMVPVQSVVLRLPCSGKISEHHCFYHDNNLRYCEDSR
jgi:hypothetical protein